MNRASYTVNVAREGRYWVASAEGVRGSAIETRLLRSLEQVVRDGLALLLDIEPGSFDISWVIELPDAARQALDAFEEARTRRRDAEDAYEQSMRVAADRLTQANLSLRDAATLMDISHQRVQQVRSAGPDKSVDA
jgi:hypothetical protein